MRGQDKHLRPQEALLPQQERLPGHHDGVHSRDGPDGPVLQPGQQGQDVSRLWTLR